MVPMAGSTPGTTSTGGVEGAEFSAPDDAMDGAASMDEPEPLDEPGSGSGSEPEPEPEPEPVELSLGHSDAQPEPDWWHRDHPTFTAIAGFFTGLVVVTVIPGMFVALMRTFFGERTAEEAFPFVLLALVVPVGLMVFPTTRRFGTYLLLGMAVTFLVVFGVGTTVFWLMMRYSA